MRTRVLIALACALTLGSAAGQASATVATPAAQRTSTEHSTAQHTAVHFKRTCGASAQAGVAECLALLRTTASGAPLTSPAASTSTLPSGYGPTPLRDAYELTAAAKAGGHGQTVAIVDAYDDPNAASDLAVYRAEYGLPACTAASGCFRKVNQAGAASPLPPVSQGWAVEESLDLDMVSAICPNCHILLVEANDASDYNLAASVARAAKLGATEISNSYGEPEHPGVAGLDKYYDQPTAKVTVSSGDSGYGVSWPAASQYVTAVGGTSLFPASNSRGWSESAWIGSGSGCSTQISKPAWQHDACSHRTVADVAADADPYTPVAVYDSYQEPGWAQVGGTSVGSPLVASVYALLGNAAHGYADGSYFYSHKQDLFPVTSGYDGTCTPAYLCTAGPGYDGPTGLGTPDLTGATSTGGSCVSGFSAVPDQPLAEQASLLAGGRSVTEDNDIAALSPNDVWTAGFYTDAALVGRATLAGIVPTLDNWNGTRWRSYPVPEFLNGNGIVSAQLAGLSFDKPDDGWAAGSNGISPEVVHWNGSTWTPTPVLTPVKTYSYNGQVAQDQAQPSAITAVSPTDVWLAGTLYNALGVNAPYQGGFLEHWDGTGWSEYSIPAADNVISLAAVHAISATDVWAVGLNTTGPVALHWNGKQWKTTPLPAAPGGDEVELFGVSGSSSHDVWAVGRQLTGVSNGMQNWIPFTEHWNGSAWSIVPVAGSSTHSGPNTEFFSIAPISPTDAWAVGAVFGADSYLLGHWNGHTWTLLPAPRPALPNGLLAVSASSATNIWITGEQARGPYQAPFILHHQCG